LVIINNKLEKWSQGRKRPIASHARRAPRGSLESSRALSQEKRNGF